MAITSGIRVPSPYCRPGCCSAKFNFKTLRLWQCQVLEETGTTPKMHHFQEVLINALKVKEGSSHDR